MLKLRLSDGGLGGGLLRSSKGGEGETAATLFTPPILIYFLHYMHRGQVQFPLS